MKNWLAVMLLLAGVSVMSVSCGGDDDPSDDPPKEEHVAVESIFSTAMKNYPIAGMSYDKSSFRIGSDARSGADAPDTWKIYVGIKNDPGEDNWNGTYQIDCASGALTGFVAGKNGEVVKANVSAPINDGLVENAWIKFIPTGKKDEYGCKQYSVTLHIDEMKEDNGDYVRNINISYTGYIYGGMLEY